MPPFCGMCTFIRQPDGTLAQIPTWMCGPEAGEISVTECRRLRLADLRTLRIAVDALLSALSKPKEESPM